MYWVRLFKSAFKTITHINKKPISITTATVGATLAVARNGNPDEPIGKRLYKIETSLHPLKI